MNPSTIVGGGAYRDRRFTGIDLAGRHLVEAEFERCRFDRCRWPGAVLERCRFHDCRFVLCDLAAARVPAAWFDGVRFERCRVTGIDWTEAVPEGSVALLSLAFEKCVLDYSTFAGLRLPGLSLRGCTVREVRFVESDLTGADLRDAELSGSIFHDTRLDGADLRGAWGYAIDPRANRMKGAHVSLPEAVALLAALDVVVE